MGDYRRSIYRILWVVTLAAMTARVFAAERVYEPSMYKPDPSNPNPEAVAATRIWPPARPQPMPTFGSNDRSRWAAIRALVEDGTFVVGRRESMPDGSWRDTGRIFEPGYDSVDKVLDPKSHQFYSTKPPLLTVLLAGEYWLLHRAGFNLDEHRWLVVRFIVCTQNVLPLGLFLWLFVGSVEQFGRTDWGRLFTYAAACFGTFLGTFAVTLNNHIPAAVAGYIAVHLFLHARQVSPLRLATSGLMAGLTASFELPAAALLAGLLWLAVRQTPRGALLWFLPAAMLPIVGQLALNYAAVRELTPIYARIDTEWYKYPGSHWSRPASETRKGIDWANEHESRPTYAFHLLLGHHGLFSLTPIWLMAFAGMLHSSLQRADEADVYRLVMRIGLFASIAVIVFYGAITTVANYGGWTSGPRWFFWLIPLWLLALIRVADGFAETRFGRGVALICLAISVFSASYPALNPWRHPWIYNWLEFSGLIPYGK